MNAIMPRGSSRSPSRAFERLLDGTRLVWISGGSQERFFFLAPFLFGSYSIVLFWIAFSWHSINGAQRVLLVFFSYMALVDSRRTPIMSAPVLRASIGRGLNASDENARLFAVYFESLGHGGHWPLGDFLSLAYFGGWSSGD